MTEQAVKVGKSLGVTANGMNLTDCPLLFWPVLRLSTWWSMLHNRSNKRRSNDLFAKQSHEVLGRTVNKSMIASGKFQLIIGDTFRRGVKEKKQPKMNRWSTNNSWVSWWKQCIGFIYDSFPDDHCCSIDEIKQASRSICRMIYQRNGWVGL